MGEALIDLIHSPQTAEPEVRIGGSPFNVAIALARLGVKTGFICPLSTDDYGHRLAQSLLSNGVRQCVQDRIDRPTAVAEVFTDAVGHPTYTFHRDGTADRALEALPPIQALPKQIVALHFGSLVLAQATDWLAWKTAIIAARDRGAFIAFDPNLRTPLIDDMHECTRFSVVHSR